MEDVKEEAIALLKKKCSVTKEVLVLKERQKEILRENCDIQNKITELEDTLMDVNIGIEEIVSKL